MKHIKPYKQTFTHSCLVVDFLMILNHKYNIQINKKIEEEILIKGMKRKYPFYVVGIPSEIQKRFRKKINILVDNKYFANALTESFNDKRNFSILHKKITLNLIKKHLNREQLLICHVDDNFFDDYSHASHFIILEKIKNNNIIVVDPMDGKRKSISQKKLMESIFSLKKHIKMCPLLYYLD